MKKTLTPSPSLRPSPVAMSSAKVAPHGQIEALRNKDYHRARRRKGRVESKTHRQAYAIVLSFKTGSYTTVELSKHADIPSISKQAEQFVDKLRSHPDVVKLHRYCSGCSDGFGRGKKSCEH